MANRVPGMSWETLYNQFEHELSTRDMDVPGTKHILNMIIISLDDTSENQAGRLEIILSAIKRANEEVKKLERRRNAPVYAPPSDLAIGRIEEKIKDRLKSERPASGSASTASSSALPYEPVAISAHSAATRIIGSSAFRPITPSPNIADEQRAQRAVTDWVLSYREFTKLLARGFRNVEAPSARLREAIALAQRLEDLPEYHLRMTKLAIDTVIAKIPPSLLEPEELNKAEKVKAAIDERLDALAVKWKDSVMEAKNLAAVDPDPDSDKITLNGKKCYDVVEDIATDYLVEAKPGKWILCTADEEEDTKSSEHTQIYKLYYKSFSGLTYDYLIYNFTDNACYIGQKNKQSGAIVPTRFKLQGTPIRRGRADDVKYDIHTEAGAYLELGTQMAKWGFVQDAIEKLLRGKAIQRHSVDDMNRQSQRIFYPHPSDEESFELLAESVKNPDVPPESMSAYGAYGVYALPTNLLGRYGHVHLCAATLVPVSDTPGLYLAANRIDYPHLKQPIVILQYPRGEKVSLCNDLDEDANDTKNSEELFWKNIPSGATLIDLSAEKDFEREPHWEPYYPVEGRETRSFGNTEVKLVSIMGKKTDPLGEKYVYKVTDLSTRDSKTIYRCHFNNWPDRDVIDVEKLKEILEDIEKTIKIPHVHCRGGVHRSGTLAAAIILRDLYKKDKLTAETYAKDVSDVILAVQLQRSPLAIQDNEQKHLLLAFCENLLGITSRAGDSNHAGPAGAPQQFAQAPDRRWVSQPNSRPAAAPPQAPIPVRADLDWDSVRNTFWREVEMQDWTIGLKPIEDTAMWVEQKLGLSPGTLAEEAKIVESAINNRIEGAIRYLESIAIEEGKKRGTPVLDLARSIEEGWKIPKGALVSTLIMRGLGSTFPITFHTRTSATIEQKFKRIEEKFRIPPNTLVEAFHSDRLKKWAPLAIADSIETHYQIQKGALVNLIANTLIWHGIWQGLLAKSHI